MLCAFPEAIAMSHSPATHRSERTRARLTHDEDPLMIFLRTRDLPPRATVARGGSIIVRSSMRSSALDSSQKTQDFCVVPLRFDDVDQVRSTRDHDFLCTGNQE